MVGEGSQIIEMSKKFLPQNQGSKVAGKKFLTLLPHPFGCAEGRATCFSDKNFSGEL